MPQITVIIATHNAQKWIRTCLKCLDASTIPLKTLVVDNASEDRTTSIIRREFQKVRVIEQACNLGFGQANNVAMRQAYEDQTDYLFLLNQDVYVYPDTVARLVNAHQTHPEYGILSPVQLNGEGTNLDYRFRKYLSRHYEAGLIESLINPYPCAAGMLPVRFVNAATWLISRHCLEKTGLFHPLFHHYGEDNNYCSRSQYQGFKTGVYAGAAARHDRKAFVRGPQSIVKKIRQVPLYTLLDIRKGPETARVLATCKMIGYVWKGILRLSPDIILTSVSEWRSLRKRWPEIQSVRREMKGTFAWSAASA